MSLHISINVNNKTIEVKESVDPRGLKELYELIEFLSKQHNIEEGDWQIFANQGVYTPNPIYPGGWQYTTSDGTSSTVTLTSGEPN